MHDGDARMMLLVEDVLKSRLQLTQRSPSTASRCCKADQSRLRGSGVHPRGPHGDGWRWQRRACERLSQSDNTKPGCRIDGTCSQVVRIQIFTIDRGLQADVQCEIVDLLASHCWSQHSPRNAENPAPWPVTDPRSTTWPSKPIKV